MRDGMAESFYSSNLPELVKELVEIYGEPVFDEERSRQPGLVAGQLQLTDADAPRSTYSIDKSLPAELVVAKLVFPRPYTDNYRVAMFYGVKYGSGSRSTASVTEEFESFTAALGRAAQVLGLSEMSYYDPVADEVKTMARGRPMVASRVFVALVRVIEITRRKRAKMLEG